MSKIHLKRALTVYCAANYDSLFSSFFCVHCTAENIHDSTENYQDVVTNGQKFRQLADKSFYFSTRNSFSTSGLPRCKFWSTHSLQRGLLKGEWSNFFGGYTELSAIRAFFIFWRTDTVKKESGRTCIFLIVWLIEDILVSLFQFCPAGYSPLAQLRVLIKQAVLLDITIAVMLWGMS